MKTIDEINVMLRKVEDKIDNKQFGTPSFNEYQAMRDILEWVLGILDDNEILE